MTPRLDIGKVLFGAFILPWRDRVAFVRRLAMPMLLLVTLSLSWDSFPPSWPRWSGWALWAAYWCAFSLFAVTVHRLMLLPKASRRDGTRPAWTTRETRFLGWLAAGGLIYLAVGTALIFVPGTVLANVGASTAVEWIVELAKLPAMYVLGRLCLLFPATALDRRPTLRWSWDLTKGQGPRLFVIVGLLPWVIAELFGLLFRPEAGFLESFGITTLITVLYIAEIAAVSLCYAGLVGDRGAG